MTEDDRTFLLDTKAECDSLARHMKMLRDRGFHVTFNLNGATGECDKFDVVQMVPIDITTKAN